MKQFATLVILVGLSLCGVAHADSMRVFSIVAMLQSGSVVGTVPLDASSGIFVDADITGVYQNASFTFSGVPILYDVGHGYMRVHYGTSALAFGIDLPTDNLEDYFGGDMCSISCLCAGSISSGVGTGSSTMLDAVLTGSLVQVNASVTPEPSTLVLLGTGLLSLTGVACRRPRANMAASPRRA